jgi:hypothetical protein
VLLVLILFALLDTREYVKLCMLSHQQIHDFQDLFPFSLDKKYNVLNDRIQLDVAQFWSCGKQNLKKLNFIFKI